MKQNYPKRTVSVFPVASWTRNTDWKLYPENPYHAPLPIPHELPRDAPIESETQRSPRHRMTPALPEHALQHQRGSCTATSGFSQHSLRAEAGSTQQLQHLRIQHGPDPEHISPFLNFLVFHIYSLTAFPSSLPINWLPSRSPFIFWKATRNIC